jgi:hypothetical protein
MADPYGTLEDAIVAQLAPLEAEGLRILNSPANRGVKMRAEALIFLSGADYDKPGAEGKLAKATLTYSINVQVEDLRTHRVAYPYLAEIRQRLQGFKPNLTELQALSRLWMNGVDYTPFSQGDTLTWFYAMTFSIVVLH